jgi:hypothetical protein
MCLLTVSKWVSFVKKFEKVEQVHQKFFKE